MKAFRNIISRIKWKSVLGLISVIALILFISWIILTLNLFGPEYAGDKNIQIRSWVEPDRVDLKDESRVWVDVKNVGKEKIAVEVNLNKRGDEILFQETAGWRVNQTVEVGHNENRKIEFKITTNTTHIGTYCIDIEVRYNGEKIPDEVCLNVVKK